MIGLGQGLALWQWWVGTGGCEGVGRRIPDVQVFEDSFDDIGIFDERDDAHVAAAAGTLKRVDLVHLLNQPGSAHDLADPRRFEIVMPLTVCRTSFPVSGRFYVEGEGQLLAESGP